MLSILLTILTLVTVSLAYRPPEISHLRLSPQIRSRSSTSLNGGRRSNMRKVNISTTLPVARRSLVTNVSLPTTPNTIKGWDLGTMKVAVANVEGAYHSVTGICPRCSFEVYKGTLILTAEEPMVACSLCQTRYNLINGKNCGIYKPPNKFTNWVGDLTRTATNDKSSSVGVDAFSIVVEDDNLYISPNT